MKLTEYEMGRIASHYQAESRYWLDCENTNRRLSEKADPGTKEVFLGDPLSGKAKTPENWKKRAEEFHSKFLSCQRRMQDFI